MTRIRVRILNINNMEETLPKLKRSLKVQANVELEDSGDGVFSLVIKNLIDLNELTNIRRLLDAYGFEFYYPEEDIDSISGCQCDSCREARRRKAR
jgi:hypothetical protein